jgi:hypothetical protein
MAGEGTSRRAILTGALAGAAVVGFGTTRVSAATRDAGGDGIEVTPLRADECTYMSGVYDVNRPGQMVGRGLTAGTAYGPLLWSGGRLSTPPAPDGAPLLELVGISDSGAYTGACYGSGMAAVLWTGGIPRTISVGSFPHTRAARMDAAGRVLVQARTDPAVPTVYQEWTWDRLFLYDHGRVTPVLPPDGSPWPDTRVIAMNDCGAVVAAVRQPGDQQFTCYFWQAGRSTWLRDIGATGSTVLPAALDDLGQVAGTVQYTEDGAEVERGFRWRAGRSELSPAVLPGGAGVQLTVADSPRAVNMRGDVVGMGSYGTDSRRPFLWSGNTLTELPVPEETQEAWAWAVNDRGDVCGWYLSHTVGYRACLWRAGQRIDLPLADGVNGSQATRVDNRGVVLSSYWRPGNESVDLYRVIGTTGGGSVTGGTSTGGGSTGGTSTGGSVTGGTSTSGGSTGGTSTGGGSTIEGATDDGATTGGTPGCHATTYNCVQWTVRS